MRALVDAALATVYTILEPVVFTETFAAGQQMSLEEATADWDGRLIGGTTHTALA